MRTSWLPQFLILTLAGCATAPPPQPQRFRHVGVERPLPMAMLDVHNRERRAFGVAALSWDPVLAARAAAYADQLARLGRLQHSASADRVGQGENLWMGSRGAYPFAVMAESWAAEKRYFHPGRFPAITNRHWSAVGHFTQMVWPATSRVGCGLGRSARWDVLVCRYAPAGNVDGVILAPR